MSDTAEPVSISTVTSWTPQHNVTNPTHAADIAKSMDSDPDRFVWAGPPLVADVEAGQLWTGVHRQEALRAIEAEYGSDCWQVPVVDIWSIVTPEQVAARQADGDDWGDALDSAIRAQLDSAQLDAVGWDWGGV